MINSHPSLSTISGQLSGISGQFSGISGPLNCPFSLPLDAAEKRGNANPAQKRRFIKPNKTGDPKSRKPTAVIGALPSGPVAIATMKCRESCSRATTEREKKMSPLATLLLLVFAALSGVVYVAVRIDLAEKEIARRRIDDMEGEQ